MNCRVRLFGLVIESPWPLPGRPETTDFEADIVVRRAKLAVVGPQSTPVPIDGGTAFRIDGLGAFAVRNGRSIEVDVAADEDERNVRLYLLGTAIGLALFQRGDVPLHANVINIGGGVIAVMGKSGSGKSTLALAARDAGFLTMSDDVAVIRTLGGLPMVSAGIPRIRLWRDALEQSGRKADDLPRAYLSEEPWDKFELSVDAPIGPDPLPLIAVYQLDVDTKLAIGEMRGAEAVQALAANVYRGDWVLGASERRRIFEWAAELAASSVVFSFGRPWSAARIHDDLGALVNHARSLGDLYYELS